VDPTVLGPAQFGANAIPLPLWALLALTLASAVPLVFAWRAMRSNVARFVIVAIWLRIVFDGWAYLTLKSYGGIKPITLLSLATVAIGVLVVDRRAWLMKAVLPIYAIIAVLIASAVLNGVPTAFLDTSVRLIYLALLMLGAFLAMRHEGAARFSAWLLVAFVPAFMLQLGSVALGVRRFTERDNSAAYVGGFGHESAFALLVIAFLVVVRFATRLGLSVRFGLILIACASLLLANYRTAIIAVAPLVAWQLAELTLSALQKRYRNAALVVFAVLGMSVAGAAVVGGGERYADVWQLASNAGTFLREPEDFNRADMQVGSGRSYLWSQYYYGWNRGGPMQHAIGQGPEASNTAFKVYAQNTLLAYLYETGIVGVILMLVLWVAMIWLAATARWPERGYLLVAHLTFVVLNMSTMPFEMIDGLVLVALLYGYTLYAHYAPRSRAASAPEPRLRAQLA
jgi:hypothetical protein